MIKGMGQDLKANKINHNLKHYKMNQMSDSKEHKGNKITRRNFFKTSATITASVLAGSSLPDAAETPPAGTEDKKKKYMWVDNHIHVSDIGPDGTKRKEFLEDLLDVLDRCDADLRFVISNDASYIGGMKTDPAAMLPANRLIYDLCCRAPGRLYGSCMVNPNFTDEALRVMRICFEEWDFVQLGEMLPYTHKYRMNDSSTEKVVRLAAQYDMPVQVHLGTWWCKGSVSGDAMDGTNQMADFLAIAERVPEAKYILAHALGSSGPTPGCVSWADMYLDILKSVFPKFPDNLWVEICNFQSPALKRTISEVPITHLLSGTDWTTRIGPPFQSYGTLFGFEEKNNPFPPKVESFIKFLRKSGATKMDIERIGYENARVLYKLVS
jgi:predicted TIM-barrel fold metal-dependent hydrolase